MIRLENITKIYNEKVDDTKALDDVSLKIERIRSSHGSVRKRKEYAS